ncbi:MAG: hypothetical protein ACP6IY_15790 [Promethearchaeia archaeon]
MKCAKCGSPLQENWIRCPNCKTLAKCPECGQPIQNIKWKICPSCDTELKVVPPSKLLSLSIVPISLVMGLILGYFIFGSLKTREHTTVAGSTDVYLTSESYMVLMALLPILSLVLIGLLAFFSRSAGLGLLTDVLYSMGLFINLTFFITLHNSVMDDCVAITSTILAIGLCVGILAGKKGGGGDIGEALTQIQQGISVAQKGLKFAEDVRDFAQGPQQVVQNVQTPTSPAITSNTPTAQPNYQQVQNIPQHSQGIKKEPKPGGASMSMRKYCPGCKSQSAPMIKKSDGKWHCQNCGWSG